MPVIDFATAKKELSPHVAGRARCLTCKHEWAAVAPIGMEWLECPECSVERSRFIYPFEREFPIGIVIVGMTCSTLPQKGFIAPIAGRGLRVSNDQA